MKFAFVALALVMYLSAAHPAAFSPDEKCTSGDGNWCVYRKAETRTCKVWTHDSFDGPELLGPFDKKDDAVAAMCNVYSPGSNDPAKCANTDPDDACKGARKKKTQEK